MRLLQICLCILFLSAAAGAPARGHGHGHRNESGTASAAFDYYLMSLSWSPSFCLTHPDVTEQCGSKGFGFVLHGLWPQNSNGTWPQHCRSTEHPDAATIEHTLAFMPSRHLVEHEWETHGTCSGLDPHAYFALADRAFAAVKIPPALRAPQISPTFSASDLVDAFVAVNPGLSENMLSVDCHNGGQLSEVRICLDKDTLAPRACGGRVRNTCRVGNLTIPAVR
jgi:ribonuclease T2